MMAFAPRLNKTTVSDWEKYAVANQVWIRKDLKYRDANWTSHAVVPISNTTYPKWTSYNYAQMNFTDGCKLGACLRCSSNAAYLFAHGAAVLIFYSPQSMLLLQVSQRYLALLMFYLLVTQNPVLSLYSLGSWPSARQYKRYHVRSLYESRLP
jgi:hypothetical protein